MELLTVSGAIKEIQKGNALTIGYTENGNVNLAEMVGENYYFISIRPNGEITNRELVDKETVEFALTGRFIDDRKS